MLSRTMRIPTVSMDIHVEYLLSYLQDELRDLEGLRIHPVAPSGTRKSVDLPQDYDPNVGQVHRNRGVRVRAGSREYFFSAEWSQNHDFNKIKQLSDEVRQFYLNNKTERL